MRTLAAATALLLWLGAPGVRAQEAKEPGAAPAAALPTYPDKPAGLRAQLQELLQAAEAGDEEKMGLLVNRLILPKPGEWFRHAFGEIGGGMAAADYSESSDKMVASLLTLFPAMNQKGYSEIEARQYDKGCKGNPSAQEYGVLLLRQQPVPLYAATLWNRGRTEGRSVWFFAYADGAFRYVGTLKTPATKIVPATAEKPTTPPDPPTPPPQSPSKRIRLRGAVQQAKLIEQSRPLYPSEAKELGLQGTVELQAVIGKDGRIKNVELVSGECLLAEAAMEAVRKWRYTPTLLVGQPVEVVTTIQVVFNLRR